MNFGLDRLVPTTQIYDVQGHRRAAADHWVCSENKIQYHTLQSSKAWFGSIFNAAILTTFMVTPGHVHIIAGEEPRRLIKLPSQDSYGQLLPLTE